MFTLLKSMIANALIMLATVSVTQADRLTIFDALLLEEKVEAAGWRAPDSAVLVVAVANDGSRRDGYAEYICLLLKEHKANTLDGERAMVKIIDAAFPTQNAWDEIELGAALCPE